jgi:hypothetical protein
MSMALTQFQREQLRGILNNEETFATTLFFLLLDTYGTEMLEWEPETIWIEVSGDFGVDLPDVNKDKVNSLILFYTTDMFQTSLETFIGTCNVLSGAEANFSRFDPADPDEMLWAFYELALHIEDPKELMANLDDDIRTYIGVTLNSYGVYDPPDLLAIAHMPTNQGIQQFSDDPLMFNAMFDKQEGEKREMLSQIALKMRALVAELDAIPIASKGKEWDEFKQKIERKLRLIEQQAPSTYQVKTKPMI